MSGARDGEGEASAAGRSGRRERRQAQRDVAALALRGEQDAAMARLAATLPHVFTRPELLVEALTHRSSGDPRMRLLDSNERLEFLGDRVLALTMAEWLAERFPQEREGELGKRLARLVSAECLAGIAERMQLADALRLPPGERQTGLATRANVLADALEALLGALYLDGGLGPARALVRREWAEAIGQDAKPPASAKTRLQEWLQQRGHPLPEYVLVSTSGPPHAPTFAVRVQAAGRAADGMGESKRAAEQVAAEAWLRDV